MTNPTNENLINGSSPTPGPQPVNSSVSIFGWKSIVAIVVSLALLVGAVYYVASRSGDKMLNEIKAYTEMATAKNDSLQIRLIQIQTDVAKSDSVNTAIVTGLQNEVKQTRNQLRETSTKLTSSLEALRLTNDTLEATLPPVCATCIAANQRLIGVADSLEKVAADYDSLTTKQDSIIEVQKINLGNFRAGLSNIGIVADERGNIISGIPKIESTKILGLKMTPTMYFLGGVVAASAVKAATDKVFDKKD